MMMMMMIELMEAMTMMVIQLIVAMIMIIIGRNNCDITASIA